MDGSPNLTWAQWEQKDQAELVRAIRQLSQKVSTLTHRGCRLAETDRSTLDVARQHIEIALKTEEYWTERKGAA